MVVELGWVDGKVLVSAVELLVETLDEILSSFAPDEVTAIGAAVQAS